MYKSVMISAYHMASNRYDVLMGFAINSNNTHDNYKIQIVAFAGTENVAVWCIFDDIITQFSNFFLSLLGFSLFCS